jgi:hypothetical protein
MNFNNATFILRNEISNLFKKELSTSDDYDLICDKVLPMFEVLKENEKLYQSIISIIFLDDYKLLFTSIMDNNYEEEDKETIRFYEENINDIDDLELYINENPYDLIEMLNSSIFFTSLDSSEQRRILNDCKIKYDYLKQVSKLHILDYLYYAAPLTLHEFLEEYDESISSSNNGDVVEENIISFSNTMSELFFSDEICYTDIILDLINNYKENVLNNELICDTELEELLNPHNDIIAICNISYQNENIRHKLLRMYLNIKRPNSTNKDYSKIKKNK